MGVVGWSPQTRQAGGSLLQGASSQKLMPACELLSLQGIQLGLHTDLHIHVCLPVHVPHMYVLKSMIA